MRTRDDGYECAFCGAVLDIPCSPSSKVTIRAVGVSPRVRSLVVAGQEIHRCELPDQGCELPA